MSAQMTREELRAAADELRIRSRAAQGLPPTCEDPVILRKVATILKYASQNRRVKS